MSAVVAAVALVLWLSVLLAYLFTDYEPSRWFAAAAFFLLALTFARDLAGALS
jgi:hypothetical protein